MTPASGTEKEGRNGPGEIQQDKPSESALTCTLGQAVSALKRGGVVAFPTDTFYGLAADPMNEAALEKIFRLKHRALDKPLLCLIHERDQLSLLAAAIPPVFQVLMDTFWPGPLTLLFPAQSHLSLLLTGGFGTVGVRQSSHPLAQQLSQAYGGPITGTSANISGQPAVCSAAEVRQQFGHGLTCILDAGKTPGGLGSTIVGLTAGRLQLVRPGVIPFAEILQAGMRTP